jgi:toxin ParE1/3/4
MAFQIVWSREALDDTERIAEYIAKDSEAYAAITVQRFFSEMEELALFPKMGRALPEIDDDAYRDWIVGAYRIVYRVEQSQVMVIAVVHGARLLTRAIGDRLPRSRKRRRE